MNLLHVWKTRELNVTRECFYIYLQVLTQVAIKSLNLHMKLLFPSSVRKGFLKVLLYVKQLPTGWLCISDMISVELEISLLALQIGTLPVLEI